MAQLASPDQDHIPPEGSSLPPPSSTPPTTLPTVTGPPPSVAAAPVTSAPTTANSSDASSSLINTSTSLANATTIPLTTSITNPSSSAPPPPTAQNGESTAASTDMSDGLPRPPVGYPSPAVTTTTYVSPSMAPTAHYPYQPVPSSQPADPYRPNPPAIGSNNGLSLPGVRTLDQMHQQPQQHMPLAAPMSVPSNVSSLYYPQPAAVMAMGHAATYGYTLGPGMLGAGRPKKEIKRRTKTGCLTCRKRRIKCDEGHPTCNNCRKSKRDCLGYDPLFKQQQVPAAIQPAPNSQQAPSQQPAARPLPAPTTLPSNTAPAYTSQPPVLLSSTAAVDPALTPVPPSVQPQALKSEPGEFPVIDPALQSSAGPSQFQQSQVKGGNLSFSPVQPSARVGADYSGQVKMEAGAKVRFDSLVDTLLPENMCPLPAAPAEVDELQRTFDQYYTQLYCPALVSFWESKWFETNPPSLHANASLRHLFKAFWSSFQPAYPDPSHSGTLETMLIWAISKLSLTTPENRNADGTLVPDTDATEIRNRIKVYDALMSGEYLDANPLVQPPALTQGHPEHHRIRQFQFWHGLAQLLTIKPGVTQEAQQGAVLNEIRYILDGRENRDVIYSIALARVYGARVDYSQVSASEYKDENDPRHKLAVAVEFIRGEAHPTGGTNCAVRRFSEYARQAFIDRRINCERPTAQGPVTAQ